MKPISLNVLRLAGHIGMWCMALALVLPWSGRLSISSSYLNVVAGFADGVWNSGRVADLTGARGVGPFLTGLAVVLGVASPVLALVGAVAASLRSLAGGKKSFGWGCTAGIAGLAAGAFHFFAAVVWSGYSLTAFCCLGPGYYLFTVASLVIATAGLVGLCARYGSDEENDAAGDRPRPVCGL